MGKVLIIKGADFTNVALNTITPSDVTQVEFYPYGYKTHTTNPPRYIKNKSYSITKYLKISSNSILTVNYASVGNGCPMFWFFDSNKNVLSYSEVNKTINTPTTISIPKNCVYIIMQSRNPSLPGGYNNPSATISDLVSIEDWETSPEDWVVG